MTKFRVGVDIGGTFTDIVFLGEDGRRLTKKVSSTVENYATAIVDGLAELIRERGLDDAEIVEVLHGTTVASNAILELKGARTGLITTKGFRDVLEIRTPADAAAVSPVVDQAAAPRRAPSARRGRRTHRRQRRGGAAVG